jgi:DNA helicase-2/ATP-dependent DNA helicase PcrA
LARTGDATKAVRLSLGRAGIPDRVLGSLGLYERSEVKDALAYLMLLVNAADPQAFRRAIQSRRRDIGSATATAVVGAREAGGDLIATCARVGELECVRSGEARSRLIAFGERLEAVRADIRCGRFLWHVVRGSGDARRRSCAVVRAAARQLGQCGRPPGRRAGARGPPVAVPRRQAFEEQQDPEASLREFLEHAIGLHAQEIDAGEDRRVTMSTIHRAKGTEATLVILLGCEEQLLPSWQSLASPDAEALCEERRLFYVAATRAKDRLILTHVRTRGGRDTAGPSRFLYEAGLLSRSARQAA